MELPLDDVFVLDGEKYKVKRPPKRMWPCQSCVFLERCEDPEFFNKLPHCKKEARSDKLPIIYTETWKNAD